MPGAASWGSRASTITSGPRHRFAFVAAGVAMTNVDEGAR